MEVINKLKDLYPLIHYILNIDIQQERLSLPHPYKSPESVGYQPKLQKYRKDDLNLHVFIPFLNE